MSIYDQKLNTKQFDFKCGKCGGEEFYVTAQVMSQGRTNTMTKNVEVAMCKECDIAMLKTLKKSAKTSQTIALVVLIVGFLAACIAFAIAMV